MPSTQVVPTAPIGQFIIGYDAVGNPLYAPSSPGLTKTIRSYLFLQYSDDDDLQAFVAAYNTMSQEYVDWFNQIGLPIYTGDMISGTLLDWVGAGLYGYTRPVLPSGRNQYRGAFNTYGYATALGYNALKRIGPPVYYATNDDVYKRCLTWHFYKGDGKVFNVRWLKRRIMRFLVGSNVNIDVTYQISISFGIGNQVNIIIYNGLRTVTGGALWGRFGYNRAMAYNSIRSKFQQFAPLALASTFKAAIDAGVLELPFQFTYTVVIIG